MKKAYVLIAALFIMSCSLSFTFCILSSPKIEIEEKNEIISYGEEYTLPKYKAYFLKKNITDEVEVNNNMNPKKLGKYEIDYTVNHLIFKTKKKIQIEIVDQEKPIIELKEGTDYTLCPNKEYEEPGYSATDNYDGDITNKVKVIKEDNKITYKVKDTSSNLQEVIRNIKKEDKENPKIELSGDQTITIYQNNSYEEPGYSATDNCDGDITSKVEVTGTVDSSRIGTYIITYKVKDNSQNETVITRTVKVISWQIIRPSGGGNGRGIVYLTFDDGPNEGTTNIILDILKEEGVEATFFVTCYGPDYLIQRMHNEGHTVALHTASHDYSNVYRSESNYFRDLQRVSDRVERLTGVKSMIIRFPGGSSNTISRRYNSGIMTRLTQEVRERGYHYFDWNVDSNDAAGAGTNGVYNNVINNISLNRENVVLMHDVKTTTRDALRNIIRYAKSNGFTFRKITNDTAMVTHGVNN